MTSMKKTSAKDAAATPSVSVAHSAELPASTSPSVSEPPAAPMSESGEAAGVRDAQLAHLRAAIETERAATDAAVAQVKRLEAELAALRTPLAVYAAELRLSEDLSLESLIASHRRLRVNRVEDQVARQAAIAQAAEEGRSVAEQMALRHGWFSRERLRTMSVGELANLLAEAQE